MINNYYGEEATALYTVPYTAASVVVLFRQALNKVWSPWFNDELYDKNYKKIQSISRIYGVLFNILIVFLILVGPEIVYILGGKSYYEARVIVPPVMICLLCQFYYSLYVNVEVFDKKTLIISVGTLISAGLNIV